MNLVYDVHDMNFIFYTDEHTLHASKKILAKDWAIKMFYKDSHQYAPVITNYLEKIIAQYVWNSKNYTTWP